MKRIMCTIYLLMLVSTNGCATIMNGSSTQEVFVTSKPPGAIVTTTTSKWIKTPGKLKLPRAKSTTLTARLSGYEDAKQEIKSELSLWILGNGVGSFFGGTLFNFLPGIALTIVDFSTGSLGQLTPTEVHFELVHKKKSAIF